MENMAEKVVYKGVSFPMLLFITFLVLKLTNVISWSWWWVTSPLWITFGTVIVLLIFVVIILGLVAFLK